MAARDGGRNVSDRQDVVGAKTRDKDATKASRDARFGTIRADRIVFDTGETLEDAEFNEGTKPENWQSGVIAEAIQIEGNYSAGLSGWAIDGYGNAEFNDVTVRGTVEASDGDIGGWSITDTGLEGNGTIEGGEIVGSSLLVSNVSGGVLYEVEVVDGRTLFRRDGVVVGSIVPQEDESGAGPGFLTIGEGVQDFSSPSGNRMMVSETSAGIFSGVWGVSVDGDVVTINGDTAMGEFKASASGGSGLEYLGTFATSLDWPVLRPQVDGDGLVGNASRRWRQVFAEVSEDISSDIRRKYVLGRSPGLDAVLQFEPIRFNWNDRDDDRWHLGLSAQNVAEVLGEGGAVVSNEDDRWGVSYAQIIPTLVAAVQELTQRLERLEATPDTKGESEG